MTSQAYSSQTYSSQAYSSQAYSSQTYGSPRTKSPRVNENRPPAPAQHPCLPGHSRFISGFLPVLMAVFLVTACSGSGAKTYTGTHIELDFSGVEHVDDGEWIEIDGVRFNHYSDFFKSQQDPYSLPATLTIAAQDTFPTHGGHHALAVVLGNNLAEIAASDTLDVRTNNNITVSSELLMYGQSRLRLQGDSSSSFTIRTSPDYGVPITVLEQ